MLRERGGDMASQLLASRARDGSFEVRYQQPFEDFRVSQEQLAEHFESRERRWASRHGRPTLSTGVLGGQAVKCSLLRELSCSRVCFLETLN